MTETNFDERSNSSTADKSNIQEHRPREAMKRTTAS